MADINGTSGHDTLNGTSSDDTINGLGGDDTINGHGGNDIIDGGYDNDTIDGGDGNDTIYGGDGRDYIRGGAGDDTIYSGDSNNYLLPEFIWDGPGNDFVYGEGGQDHINAGPGNDHYDGGTGGTQSFEGDSVSYAEALGGIYLDMRLSSGQVRSLGAGDAANVGIDTLVNFEGVSGSPFGDVMIGSDAWDRFNGGEGDDIFDAGGGNDTLTGGGGTDTFRFEAGADADVIADLTEGETVEIRGYVSAQSITQSGSDVIVVLSDTDRITFQNATVAVVEAALQFPDATGAIDGTSGDDVLDGTSGDDTINGLGGNDILDGGAGNDMLDGGAGIDTASYWSATSGVVVSLLVSGPQNSGGAGTDTLVSIENLTGSAYADRLSGNAAANVLVGLAGNDFLDGRAGNDRIEGGDGNDRLDGGKGDDTLIGGAGNDVYVVESAGDSVIEGSGGGIDWVKSTISFVLPAEVENLILVGTGTINAVGNDLDNRLAGNTAANTLNGGAGVDTMMGGLGDDVYIVDNSADRAVEWAGGGVDWVRSEVSFVLRGDVENLMLTGTGANNGTGSTLDNVILGNSAANVLAGGDGNDKLDGGAGDDLLKGGNGDDWLEGGAGRENIYGGAGADQFVFRDGDFAGLSALTCDKLNDFSQAEGDKLHLGMVDADVLADGDQAFQFIGTGGFNNVAGELRYETLNGNTYVYGDTDGDGAADFMVRLVGTYALTEGDFVI